MKNIYVTEIKAVCPKSGELKTYCGPEISAISVKDAEDYCENNGLGYCKVIGLLVAEIPCKNQTYEPDFKNMIDYEKIKNS